MQKLSCRKRTTKTFRTKHRVSVIDAGCETNEWICQLRSPHFVNNQLVCLLPAGVLNWKKEGILNISTELSMSRNYRCKVIIIDIIRL